MADNSVDAVVTDPPAGISFMGKEWDHNKGGRQEWIAWLSEAMSEVLRLLKPGAHGLVWALPRTSHWTATALEDASFEIRDRVSHIFGSGFPKSLNLGNGLGTALKPAVEDWWLVRKPLSEKNIVENVLRWGTGGINIDGCRIEGSPIKINTYRDGTFDPKTNLIGLSQAGKEYSSKTSLSGRFPSHLILSHSSECRPLGTTTIQGNGHYPANRGIGGVSTAGHSGQVDLTERHLNDEVVETWECVDGCPVKMLDKQSGIRCRGHWPKEVKANNPIRFRSDQKQQERYTDQLGTASRFFYCVKASRSDRGEGNEHPTVKNTKLMAYLCRLITPPNGRILDPFMGSGSTGVACVNTGRDFIGIEKDAGYFEIAKKRIEAAQNKARQLELKPI